MDDANAWTSTRARRRRQLTDRGGTPGGLSPLLLALALYAAAGHLLVGGVAAAGRLPRPGGYSILLLALPLIAAGVIRLLFRGRSRLGWLLVVAPQLVLFGVIIDEQQIHFRPAPLGATLLLLALLAAASGLLVRATHPPA